MEQEKPGVLKNVLNDVVEDVKGGASLSDAFGRHQIILGNGHELKTNLPRYLTGSKRNVRGIEIKLLLSQNQIVCLLLSTSHAAAPTRPAAGMVMNQAVTMVRATPQFTRRMPLVVPTPVMALEMT